MSRVAKKPIVIPAGVEINIAGSELKVKGPKGSAQFDIDKTVSVVQEGEQLLCSPLNDDADALAGTTRALVKNMIDGVTTGFTRKLLLVGVGFKAQSQGNILNLIIGFSHPIKFNIPEGITIETPSQTEVIIKGTDKRLVGQVAAEIRAFRPPEPYKGKGIRYEGEVIVQKEGKKK